MSKTRQIDKIQCAKTLILSLQQVSVNTHFIIILLLLLPWDVVLKQIKNNTFCVLFLTAVQWNAVRAGPRFWPLLLRVLWNQRVGPAFLPHLWSWPGQNQRCHCYAAQVRPWFCFSCTLIKSQMFNCRYPHWNYLFILVFIELSCLKVSLFIHMWTTLCNHA